VSETAPRARNPNVAIAQAQVLDKAAEIVELKRLADEALADPELRARFNAGAGGATSFDIHIERNRGGAPSTERRVEVFYLQTFPTNSRALHPGVVHGAQKLTGPPAPGAGTAESTVVIPATGPGGRTFPMGPNQRVFDSRGNYRVEQVTPAGPVVRYSSSLGADLLSDLNSGAVTHPNLRYLDAVNVVDDGGQVICRLERHGTVWVRTA